MSEHGKVWSVRNVDGKVKYVQAPDIDCAIHMAAVIYGWYDVIARYVIDSSNPEATIKRLNKENARRRE